MSICPLCNLEASVSSAPRRDAWIITCNRCGKFLMAGGLLNKNWSNLPQEDARLLPYISAYTRQRSESGTVVELDFNNWRDCARQHSNTPTNQKLCKLLTFIADRAPRVGFSIKFDCELDYPLIDAASAHECEQFLARLKERNYIDAYRYNGFIHDVSITVDGQEYLEQMSRQSIDRMDLEAVPEVSRYDLLKAASRFWDGDLGGALAAACGAVDAACARVYEEKGLGDPAKAQSFQQKVMNSLRANDAFKRLETELTGIGWDSGDAHRLAQNLEGSLNQATYVMQTLRSKMSDAHGSKLALEAVVFDSLKWATIMASQLK